MSDVNYVKEDAEGCLVNEDDYVDLWQRVCDMECPEETTRTAILALRNSSQLKKDCHYVLTDYSRGTVGQAKILLHAIDANTLSMNAMVKTTFDNVAWQGTYDIDANRLESLHDNLGNDIYGQNSVDTFPWGNNFVFENEVREGTLNHSGGSFRENYIGSGTVVTSNGTVDQNRFEQNASVTIAGGVFAQNNVMNDADVQVNSGTNIDNTFDSSSTYRQVGSGFIRFSHIGGNAAVINGNTNISDLKSFDTDLNTTGSNGSISGSDFSNSNLSNLRNIDNLVISDCSFNSRTQVLANNARLLRLFRCHGDSNGRFLVGANTTMTCNYCRVTSFGYIQTVRGSLTCIYSSATELGFISNQSSGSNNVDRSHASTQANIRFLGSTTGGRIYYSTTSSGGTIYQGGDSVNCYHYYCSASNRGQVYIENCTDARHYHSSATNFSYLRAYGNNTGQSIMFYCNAHARGYVEHLNIGSRQRFYSIDASSQGIFRQTGGTNPANAYYSHVSSFYYALLTLSGITRTGLHGNGRQTFNGTPPTNGTGQRNWI